MNTIIVIFVRSLVVLGVEYSPDYDANVGEAPASAMPGPVFPMVNTSPFLRTTSHSRLLYHWRNAGMRPRSQLLRDKLNLRALKHVARVTVRGPTQALEFVII